MRRSASVTGEQRWGPYLLVREELVPSDTSWIFGVWSAVSLLLSVNDNNDNERLDSKMWETCLSWLEFLNCTKTKSGLDSVSVFPVITAVSLHNVNMQNMAKTCLHLQCSVCTRTLYSLALLVLYRLGRRYNSSESTHTSLSCLLTRGTSLAPAELSVPSPWDKQDTETKWRRGEQF